MVFDIPSQMLNCGRCDRTESIEEADRREYRKAGSNFSVDVLTCPTCGAEIRAMNAAQAAFCSYCGSEVMLEQRTAELFLRRTSDWKERPRKCTIMLLRASQARRAEHCMPCLQTY